MARTSAAKSAVAKTTVEDSAVVETSSAVENIESVEVEQENESVVEKPTKVASLSKDDEIDVVSLIPNVSYKDFHTGDIYNWDEVGQVESLTFEVVQRMWQQSKDYFKSMWLKPLDERVVKKLGLKDAYEKYDFLMDEANYTKDNIDEICDCIANTPSALKFSLCNKVKSLVSSGKVTDIGVIRAMERNLKIDLLDLVR